MDAKELTEELNKTLRKTPSSPLLFVGSGLSRRYSNAPDWKSLLTNLASLTDKPYNYYAGKTNNDLLQIGTLISERFYETWWDDQKYEEEREQYKNHHQSKSFPLKLQIAKIFSDLSIGSFSELEESPYREELALLRQANVNGIITTNYDNLSEQIFDKFTPFVGQQELLFEPVHHVGEIFKIHGCASKPSSIVITKEDYDEFDKKSNYLAAKLLTFFIEHPVVFLGYSVNDRNVRQILRAVSGCLDEEKRQILSERLIFVAWNETLEDPQMVNHSIDLDGDNLPTKYIETSSFTPIFKSLCEVERRLSADVIRKIKDHIYELTLTSDPKAQIKVVDIDNLNESDDIEFVVGVGLSAKMGQKGFSPIERDELIRDVATNGNKFKGYGSDIVRITINNWLGGGRKIIPVYKYLHDAKLLTSSGTVKRGTQLPSKVRDHLNLQRRDFEPNPSRQRRNECENMTLSEAIDKYKEKAIHVISLLDITNEELEEYIYNNVNLLESSKHADAFRKLVTLYDGIKYGPF